MKWFLAEIEPESEQPIKLVRNVLLVICGISYIHTYIHLY